MNAIIIIIPSLRASLLYMQLRPESPLTCLSNSKYGTENTDCNCGLNYFILLLFFSFFFYFIFFSLPLLACCCDLPFEDLNSIHTNCGICSWIMSTCITGPCTTIAHLHTVTQQWSQTECHTYYCMCDWEKKQVGWCFTDPQGHRRHA